jgi:hypothetical protein
VAPFDDNSTIRRYSLALWREYDDRQKAES